MQKKRDTFIVLVKEDFVRDVQVFPGSNIPNDDGYGYDWFDTSGDLSLGTYEADDMKQAIEYASEDKELDKDILHAYQIYIEN